MSKTRQVKKMFKKYNKNIDNFVKKWGEDTQFIKRLINKNLNQKDKKYLDDTIGILKHNMDSRSPSEYALELVRGWLLEDLIVDLISSQGLPIKLSGADKNRKFKSKNISASPDLKIKNNYIELVSDYTGFWKKEGRVDLRDNKYDTFNKEKNALLLGIDLKNNQFFLLSKEEVSNNGEKGYNHAWKKEAYQIDLSNFELYDLKTLCQKIQQKM